MAVGSCRSRSRKPFFALTCFFFSAESESVSFVGARLLSSYRRQLTIRGSVVMITCAPKGRRSATAAAMEVRTVLPVRRNSSSASHCGHFTPPRSVFFFSSAYAREPTVSPPTTLSAVTTLIASLSAHGLMHRKK